MFYKAAKPRRVRNILARPNGQNKNYERGTAVLGAKMGIVMQTTNQTTKQTTFHPQADQTNDQANTSRTQPASPLPTQRERSHKTVLFLTQSAVIAALYIVFTMVSAAFGLSSGVIQVRISEAMCILPAFTPAAIPGLTIGCFIANLLSGGVILDAVFGGLATLLGAVGAYLLGRVLHKNNPVKGVVLSPAQSCGKHTDCTLGAVSGLSGRGYRAVFYAHRGSRRIDRRYHFGRCIIYPARPRLEQTPPKTAA